MTIYSWSTTAASNASADGTINFAENQAPSTVNDSARSLMARVAAWVDTLGGALTYGGSSNAYTATSPSGHALTAYAAGIVYMLKANHTNTGAATLNVDGLGAKSIKTADGGDVIAGDIVSGGLYLLAYDGTNFQIVNTIGGGSYQPLDATLTAWGALAGSANQIAYWTGTDTFALTSLTSFGRSLVDDADAAAGRTTLGATTVGSNLFTLSNPGAVTFPRFNADNTVSSLSASAFRTAIGSTTVGDAVFIAADAAAGRTALGALASASYTAADVLAKLLTVDGAGSLLDADTVDGLQASALGQLSASQTWAGQNTFDSASIFRSSGTVKGYVAIGTAVDGGAGTDMVVRGEDGITLSLLGSRAARVSSSGFDLSTGTLLAPIRISAETSGTLTDASRNRQVHCSGNITLPASGMTDGDIILIDPRGTARTITRPAAHTMYVNDVDVATATTPAHNLVSAKFCGGAKWVLQGAV